MTKTQSTGTSNAGRKGERGLYGPVATFLQQREYEIKIDTKYGDVVGYDAHRGLLAAAEVKSDDARSAFGQALSYGDFADIVWVCVPKTANFRADLLERLGLGLLVMQKDGPLERLTPRVNRAKDHILRSRVIAQVLNVAGLHDVARSISHYGNTQRALVFTIRALGPKHLTFNELRKKTGLNERYLRYIITLLRSHGIIRGERGKEYRYCLTPDAYVQHVKSVTRRAGPAVVRCLSILYIRDNTS